MATFSENINYKSDLNARIGLLRERITIECDWLRDQITRRENKLLEELVFLEKRINKEAEAQINTLGLFIQLKLKLEVADTGAAILDQLQPINENIDRLQKSITTMSINLSWDKSQIEKMLTSFGRFQFSIGENALMTKPKLVFPLVNNVPILSKCSSRTNPGQLKWPRGIAVDHTSGNIFVVDQHLKTVQLFTPDGHYMYQFGQDDDLGKLVYPTYVTVYKEEVYVTDYDTCAVNVYTLMGKYLRKFGTTGCKGDGQFAGPFGIAVHPVTEDLYVCDKNKIQIFDCETNFKFSFGDDHLVSTRDIKFSNLANEIFVLDAQDLCMHVFDFNHFYLISVINRGPNGLVLNPYYFDIDGSNNIILSDHDSNQIIITGRNGMLEFRLGENLALIKPNGVVLDSRGRIITVWCGKNSNCLQIF